jgi:hypothetical protein
MNHRQPGISTSGRSAIGATVISSGVPVAKLWLIAALLTATTTAAFPEKLSGRLPHLDLSSPLSVYSRYGLPTR